MAELRPQHEARGRERAMNNNNSEGYFFFTTVFASIRPRRTRPGGPFGVLPRKKRRLLRRMERPNRPPAAAVAGPPLPEMNLACRRQAAPGRRRAACRGNPRRGEIDRRLLVSESAVLPPPR